MWSRDRSLRYGDAMYLFGLLDGCSISGLFARGLAGAALLGVGCSDDGVGTPQSTESGVSAGTGQGDDGGPGGGSGDGGSGAGDGTGNGPGSTSSATADAGSDEGTAGGGETTGGGFPTEPECRVDEDCVVVNDCCTCDAAPVDEKQVECPKACLQSTCDALGLFDAEAQCQLGLCTFVPKSCNPALVSCDSIPPECFDGFAPEVEGECWSGECVPLQFCDVVPSCEVCGRAETCVAIESQLGPWFACEPIAPACEGTPSCACMGELCPPPYTTCADSGDGLSCTCPNC